MSLTISPVSAATPLVANTGTMPLLTVSVVNGHLMNEDFLTRVDPSVQVNVLDSAGRYLEETGAEERVLASCRSLIEWSSNPSEPTVVQNAQMSNIRVTWTLRFAEIQRRHPEEAAPAPSAPPSEDRPRTPPPPAASPAAVPQPGARLFEPLPVDAAALETGDRASLASANDENDRGLFPLLWWDPALGRQTRLGLKNLALTAAAGRVNELTRDNEAHAQLLASALAGWFGQIVEILNGERDKKEKVSGPRLADVLDLAGMGTDLLRFFRHPDRRTSALGEAFWRTVSEHKDIHFAHGRLISRALQSAMDDDAKGPVEALAGAYERGIVEAIVMPLFETRLPAHAADEEQGAETATQLNEPLNRLPFTVRHDLNEEQVKALGQAELALRLPAQKMRGNPDSAFVSAFYRGLGGYATRLWALSEMVRARRPRPLPAILSDT